MAEDQNQPIVTAPVPDPADHNAQVAAKLAAQDAAGKSTAGTPGEFEEAGTALDKLAAQVTQQPPPADPNAPPVQPAQPQKTAEELAAEAAAKAEAEKKAADEAAAKEAAQKLEQQAAEVFKDVPQLPQGSSTKASESWNALKAKAAQEISARDTQLAELRKQNAELTQRINTPTTQQMEAEKTLKEVNEWRAKLDVEFDPKFKQFDAGLTNIHEFVYAQLRQSPAVSEDVINEIKKLGGPEKCNLTKLFEQMKDPTLQRIVEQKMSDALMVRHQKDEAIKYAKTNIGEYLKQREEAFRQAQTSHTDATKKELEPMLGAMDWYSKPKVDDPAAKQFVDELKGQLASALQDDSPQMRAILLAGFAKMCYLTESAKKTEAELADVKTKLTEAEGKLARIKESATSRLRESNAAPGATTPAPKKDIFHTPAVDALDAAAKQVMEARAAQQTR